jgi:hypothetical protein
MLKQLDRPPISVSNIQIYIPVNDLYTEAASQWDCSCPISPGSSYMNELQSATFTSAPWYNPTPSLSNVSQIAPLPTRKDHPSPPNQPTRIMSRCSSHSRPLLRSSGQAARDYLRPRAPRRAAPRCDTRELSRRSFRRRHRRVQRRQPYRIRRRRSRARRTCGRCHQTRASGSFRARCRQCRRRSPRSACQGCQGGQAGRALRWLLQVVLYTWLIGT